MIKFSTVMVLARDDDDFGLLKDWDLQTPARANIPGVMISPTCWDPSLPSFGKAAENAVGSAMISNFRRR